VGLGAGIVSKKLRDSALDREAQAAYDLKGEQISMDQQLETELKNADPDEARMLDHARRISMAGWAKLQAGDESGRKMIEDAQATMAGIIGADMQARKADEAAAMNVQRNLIGTAATSYRAEYQTNLSQNSAINEQAAQILSLVADPDFDPNKPVNRARLAELASTGMGMYRDSPDMWDAATQGSNAFRSIPVVGDATAEVIGAVVTGIKSADFKITREDYNRFALNMKDFSDRFTRQKMEQLGTQAQTLDQFARKTRTIADDYSLADYISGGVRDLKLQPVPKLPAAVVPDAPPSARQPSQRISPPSWSRPTTRTRPTN
jgi:hypothetical protein